MIEAATSYLELLFALVKSEANEPRFARRLSLFNRLLLPRTQKPSPFRNLNLAESEP